jgi:hypothetical protein
MVHLEGKEWQSASTTVDFQPDAMQPWPMYMEQTPFFTDDEQVPKQMKQSGDGERTSGNCQD